MGGVGWAVFFFVEGGALFFILLFLKILLCLIFCCLFVNLFIYSSLRYLFNFLVFGFLGPKWAQVAACVPNVCFVVQFVEVSLLTSFGATPSGRLQPLKRYWHVFNALF